MIAPSPRPVFSRPGFWAIIVFLLCLLVYNLNGIPLSSSDNKPSLLLPHALLTRGSIDLTPYFTSGALTEHVPYYYRQRDRWLTSDKTVFYSIVATPFYLAGWGLVRTAYGPLPELKLAHLTDDVPLAWFAVEKAAASSMAAATSAVFLLVLWVYWRRRGVALAGTAAFAFFTSHWATSSQGLWNHGGLALLIAALLLAWARLERATRDRLTPRAIRLTLLAGSLAAAWAMPVRTTGAGYALAWLVYVAWRWRHHFWLAAAPIGAMAAVFFAFNLWVAHDLAGYYGTRAAPFWAYGLAENLKAWAGLLVSPGAGLFVFTPLAALSAAGALLAWRRPDEASQALRSWIGPVLFCYAAAATNTDAVPQLRWHAAASYGPRYFVDTLPLLTLFGVHAALTIAPWLAHRSRGLRLCAWAGFTAIALWSLGTQGVGVFYFKFNHALRPQPIHERPERMWDWRDNPLVREVRTGLNPDVCAAWSALTGGLSHPLALDPTTTRALVTPLDASAAWTAGERRMIEVEICNAANRAWPGSLALGLDQLAVTGQWQRTDGATFPAVPAPTALTGFRGLAPAASRRMPVLIAAPSEPGSYALVLTLRQGAREFSGGTPPAAAPVLIQVARSGQN